MSTTAVSDRKRKPSDLSPGPVFKHIKVDNTTITGAMTSSGMAGSGQPPMNIAQHRAALQQLLNAQAGMPEETKIKYLSGLDGLRAIVDSKGLGSTEGMAAQNKYDSILTRLKIAARNLHAQQQQQQLQQQQQQQLQQQQLQQQQQQPQYQQVQSGMVPVPSGAATINGGMGPTAKQHWIVPANVPPQNAEQWRSEIQAKLAQVGLKMNQARAQIVQHQQNLTRPGVTMEQQRELQTRIVEHTGQFNHFKEIISKFGAQQKMLAEQQKQQQAVQMQQQAMMAQQQQQAQAQMRAATGQQQQPPQQGQAQPQAQQPQVVAMQKAAQQGMAPESHVQQGMMNAGLQQGIISAGNNGQQNSHPQQRPQQPHQPQPQPQQQQQQQPPPQSQSQPQSQPQPQQPQNSNTAAQQQQQQQQRISTPIQLANSPPNSDANRTTMSPAPSQSLQQPTAQQNGQSQTPRPALQSAQQPASAARSSVPPSAAAAAAAGTTPMAQPNSPAPPRAGSVQPARPPTAAGTPVPQPSQPGQQQPQQQPQQQARMQPATSASAASPITNSHPAPTTRDTAQGHRLPIPKSLAVVAPQPIAMPPARPTLSGGMNSSGNQMMSTPAIIKQPAFEFDEAGMGLLSKRKLEELVKQIDPEERLDPDVEESILELVDEFIDNVATTACKMAKLRGSDTLDIKDIQIILERNWNIRIPGYAADEIRTVRKFNPAPGYHQKMTALAAQKQLNQTAGKGGD